VTAQRIVNPACRRTKAAKRQVCVSFTFEKHEMRHGNPRGPQVLQMRSIASCVASGLCSVAISAKHPV